MLHASAHPPPSCPRGHLSPPVLLEPPLPGQHRPGVARRGSERTSTREKWSLRAGPRGGPADRWPHEAPSLTAFAALARARSEGLTGQEARRGSGRTAGAVSAVAGPGTLSPLPWGLSSGDTKRPVRPSESDGQPPCPAWNARLTSPRPGPRTSPGTRDAPCAVTAVSDEHDRNPPAWGPWT